MASSAPGEREEESGEAAGVRAGVRHRLNEAGERGNAPMTPGADGGCGLDSRGGCGRRETALTGGLALSARPREGRRAAGALALAAAVLGRGVGPRRKGKRPVRPALVA